MNQQASGPATPALKDLAGQSPLVYVTRVPEAGERDEPAWEIAVFDDGTLVYEGHRCVATGGVLVTRLRADELTSLRDALETSCPDVEPANDDELCPTRATVRVACAAHERLRVASDHCRERYPSLATRVDALLSTLESRSDLASWVGDPTRRLSCTAGARDLSPHDLARTIRSDLVGLRR